MNDQARQPKLHLQRKYLPILAAFAAKKDIRYYLNGFHIKPHPQQGVVLTATDGHRLVTIHDKEGSANGEYIFPISKALLAASKKAGARHFPSDRVEIVGHQLRITSLDTFLPDEDVARLIGLIAFVEYISPIDGVYPDAAKIFSGFAPAPVQRIGLNPNYAATLGLLSKNTKIPCVELMFNAKNNAIAVVGGWDNEIVAMVMPMKLDSQNQALPEFVKFAGNQREAIQVHGEAA